MPEFTTIVALDKEHLPEFALSWPTWYKLRPEIVANPLLLLCDGCEPATWWERQVAPFLTHDDVRFVEIGEDATVTQRHRMLNAFISASHLINTDWYLKLDTDVAAVRADHWIEPEWFTGGTVLVASPWGYTKPAAMYLALESWARNHPVFDGCPMIRSSGDPRSSVVRHRRIISYVMFGEAEFTRRAADMCGSMLPIPSQDTYLWYLAERLGYPYRRVPFKAMGWLHSKRQLRAAHDHVMEAVE